MIIDYYKILGAKYNEPFSHLRIRYIKKVMPLHPENSQSNLEEFIKLNEAFYILSHTEYKEYYNRFYQKEILGKDLSINQKYFKYYLKKWAKLSARKSKKYAKMSARDFFESIPKAEVERGYSVWEFFLFDVLDILRITGS